MLASRLGAAWLLIRDPSTRVVLASYGESLAKRLSLDARRYFVAMGGRLDPTARALGAWDTHDRGGLWAAGVGGALTGVGARTLILDDLLRGREDADSPFVRLRTIDWLRSVAWTRLEPPDDAVIIIGTRWHADDPIGWLLQQEEGADHPQGWHILNLDHEYDPGQREFPASCTVLPDWRTEPGALVCPQRWSADKVAEIKSLLGAREWSSLHQQRPVPRAGLMFSIEDFRVVDAAPASSHAVRAWDLAATDKKTSDQTAGVLISQVGSGENRTWYVHNVVSGRWTPHKRLQKITSTARRDGPEVVQLFEEEVGSAGKAVTQQLISAIAPSPGTRIRPTGQKIVRAQAFSAQVEAGNVHLVRGPWMQHFLDEIAMFPAARHDDQVEAACHAFNQLASESRRLDWQDIY